ncbi:MAG: nicotinamide-nucleotide amidohydrolase family protein [bacterium]
MTDAEPLRVTILIVGDELLAGEIADRNGPFFAEQLTGRGFRVQEVRILPDETDTLTDAVRGALAHSTLTVVCGGLGPTSDDRTTEAVALALGRETVRDEDAWQHIRGIFGMRNIEPPPGNEKQAFIPTGAEVLPNLRGTAPGYLVTEGASAIAVLPGPPRENRPLFTDVLLPRLADLSGDAPLLETRVFRVFGLPESEVGSRLRGVEARFPALRFGYQARFPEILVKIRHDTATRGPAEAAAGALREALAPHLYVEGDTTLPEVLGRSLERRALRIVTAESCTGGLAAKLLTDIPGSSAWMERGFVTYTNAAKIELLGVDEALLADHGAVSEPVAEAMLAGALERSPADVGVAITGIAGPTGGTADKPVGTVCIAWGDRQLTKARTTRFPFDRELNRLVSAWAAFGRLYRHIHRSAQA